MADDLAQDVKEMKTLLGRLIPLIEEIRDEQQAMRGRQIEDGKTLATIQGELKGLHVAFAAMQGRQDDQMRILQLALAGRMSRPDKPAA